MYIPKAFENTKNIKDTRMKKNWRKNQKDQYGFHIFQEWQQLQSIK